MLRYNGSSGAFSGVFVSNVDCRGLAFGPDGPSLAAFGVPGVLANPMVQLFSGPTPIALNDDWQTSTALCQASGYTCGGPSDIAATGLAPSNPLESAILIALPPGPYTAIVSGVGGTMGVGLVEVFEANGSNSARLVNISTRGRVNAGDGVMIGGFVIGGSTAKKAVVRAVGPSLADFGVPGVLANPFLRLYSGQTPIAENDDWQVSLPLCQSSGFLCRGPGDIALQASRQRAHTSPRLSSRCLLDRTLRS